MRPFIALALFVAAAALAEEKSTSDVTDSASGGATAPTASVSRDASESRALFQRLDKNKDGYLTGTELTSAEALAANWISVDRDADGRISLSEFTALTGATAAASK